MKTSTMSKASGAQAQAFGQAVRGIVVSIPGAGFYVIGERGQRHPLDGREFATGREARAALAAFDSAA